MLICFCLNLALDGYGSILDWSNSIESLCTCAITELWICDTEIWCMDSQHVVLGILILRSHLRNPGWRIVFQRPGTDQGSNRSRLWNLTLVDQRALLTRIPSCLWQCSLSSSTKHRSTSQWHLVGFVLLFLVGAIKQHQTSRPLWQPIFADWLITCNFTPGVSGHSHLCVSLGTCKRLIQNRVGTSSIAT